MSAVFGGVAETARFGDVHYVGRGSVRPAPFEGWATFTTIFNQRPDEHRFAIACTWSGQWVCWDLYDEELAKVPEDGVRWLLPPIWRAPTEEALTMRALALYDHE